MMRMDPVVRALIAAMGLIVALSVVNGWRAWSSLGALTVCAG